MTCGNCVPFIGARASMLPHNTMARTDPPLGSIDHTERERYKCTVCRTDWVRYRESQNFEARWVLES